jgi:hypothetical protein
VQINTQKVTTIHTMPEQDSTFDLHGIEILPELTIPGQFIRQIYKTRFIISLTIIIHSPEFLTAIVVQSRKLNKSITAVFESTLSRFIILHSHSPEFTAA